MAVAEFQGQFFEERDLEKFSSSCSTPVDVKTVVGANRSSAGVEAELDIEYIKAVAPVTLTLALTLTPTLTLALALTLPLTLTLTLTR